MTPNQTDDVVASEPSGRRHPRQGNALGGLTLLALVLLLLSIDVPPLAVLAAWPFLVAIPGSWLVARVAPALSVPGRVGVGIVASVFIASHLVNAVSLLVGFGRPAIVLVAAALILVTWALATRPLPFLADPPAPSVAGFRRTLVRDRSAWLLGAGTALIVLVILAVSSWHQTADGWVSGGWNWSDFLVHVSIATSILDGNFPPQVPSYAGVPLTYHWFADFDGAILASVARLSIIPVLTASSALLAGSLALVAWELARKLTRNRRAAAIAVLLACFGGGLGWIRLPLDLAQGQHTLLGLLTTNPYDNTWAADWPFFRIASVLGTGLLTHRATTFGLPGVLAVVLLVHVSLGRRPAGMLLAGVLAALLAPFQFFFFPATYLIVFLMVVARRAWRQKTVIRDAALFLVPVVLALPFITGAILAQSDRGAFRFVLGWSESRIADGIPAALFFYVTNLGLPVLLAIVAIAWRRRLAARAFLALWLVALFLVPNLVVLSAVEFDMNKYFQLMWVAAAILAAWLIWRWPRPLIAATVGISTLSPALIALWFVISTPWAMSVPQEHASHWIEANTPLRSVFVTDSFINSPVDLAGRLRLTTFEPYVENLGYASAQRSADVHSVYCDGDVAAAAIMRRYGATYVLSSGGLLECNGHASTHFGTRRLFATVYDIDGVTIWKLLSP